MRVFLSWSGKRSRAVAQAFNDFLPQVMNAVEPWISQDIQKGAHWPTELARNLEQSRIAIICLTAEASHSPWLLFEAGVLFKGIGQGAVCPYLVDLPTENLTGPLAHFQVTQATRDDTYGLIKTLNLALGEQARPEGQLEKSFNVFWPEFASQLKEIRGSGETTGSQIAPAVTQSGQRSPTEKLDYELAKPDLDPALKRMLLDLKHTDWQVAKWRSVNTLARNAEINSDEAHSLLMRVPEIVQLGRANDRERKPLARIWGIPFAPG